MPIKVLIAGGGIAALEAVLALREHARGLLDLSLLAPEAEFTLRPLAAVEPFALGKMQRIPLAQLADELGFTHHSGRLSSIDSEAREIRTDADEALGYDALLVTVGARANEAVPGALTYGGPGSNGELAHLLASIRDGQIGRVGFVVPPDATWPLPLYELALLTATRARHWRAHLRVDVITAEGSPLGIFGRRASGSVADLLAEHEIRTITSARAIATDAAGIRLDTGRIVGADRVVALPRLDVPNIEGLPQRRDGFIETDRYMRVQGANAIWAAGDATWFPVKQGGIAAQQADVAARSIAAVADNSITPEAFRPVLRGALLTGRAPRYLRTVGGARDEASVAGDAPLWWPPAKVAGRLLGPYLGRARATHDPQPGLADIDPDSADELAEVESEHRDAVELALTAAEADARWRDFHGALRWLDVAEHLNLTLPGEYARKRELWAVQAEGAVQS